MSEILTLQGINQYFHQGNNKINVLKNLDLYIGKAKKIAIIGASGSGKSTLLNIASLMQSPKSGKIYILGNSATNLHDNDKSRLRKSSIGYIHQRNSLLMEFTAFENIYISLMLNNYNKSYGKEKTMELLKLVNMEHRGKHKPSSLSGGEQQRIAIARAISNSPELIVADEPTGNLDKKNSEKIIEELINISEINKTSLLLATHDLSIAKKMDKIYNLNNGKLSEYR